jgi:hypothetical protein
MLEIPDISKCIFKLSSNWLVNVLIVYSYLYIEDEECLTNVLSKPANHYIHDDDFYSS